MESLVPTPTHIPRIETLFLRPSVSHSRFHGLLIDGCYNFSFDSTRRASAPEDIVVLTRRRGSKWRDGVSQKKSPREEIKLNRAHE